MQTKSETLKKIQGIIDERQTAATRYSKAGCCELAYLAKWSILEFAFKELDMLKTQYDQHANLTDLLRYLNEGGTQPKQGPIKVSVKHRDTLPKVTRIPELLGDCPELLEIFDTQKKYRKKRNNIAHKAETLTPKTCAEYLEKLDAGIKEFMEAFDRINWMSKA
jgi:hypothetical protein